MAAAQNGGNGTNSSALGVKRTLSDLRYSLWTLPFRKTQFSAARSTRTVNTRTGRTTRKKQHARKRMSLADLTRHGSV